MQVKLTPVQYDFLKVNLGKEKPELFSALNIKDMDSFNFELDDDVAEDIREWALEKQVVLGFDIDYNMNQNGIILESLIDLLYQ